MVDHTPRCESMEHTSYSNHSSITEAHLEIHTRTHFSEQVTVWKQHTTVDTLVMLSYPLLQGRCLFHNRAVGRDEPGPLCHLHGRILSFGTCHKIQCPHSHVTHLAMEQIACWVSAVPEDTACSQTFLMSQRTEVELSLTHACQSAQ